MFNTQQSGGQIEAVSVLTGIDPLLLDAFDGLAERPSDFLKDGSMK